MISNDFVKLVNFTPEASLGIGERSWLGGGGADLEKNQAAENCYCKTCAKNSALCEKPSIRRLRTFSARQRVTYRKCPPFSPGGLQYRIPRPDSKVLTQLSHRPCPVATIHFKAGTGACPYDPYDSVEMVGHNHVAINFDTRVMIRQRLPCRLHQSPCIVQEHFPFPDLPEQGLPPLRAHRHKIRPGLRVIVIPQADGPATMNVRIVFHLAPHLSPTTPAPSAAHQPGPGAAARFPPEIRTNGGRRFPGGGSAGSAMRCG